MNADLGARIREIWRAVEGEPGSAGDLDAMDRFFDPGFVRRSDEGDATLADFKAMLAALHDGFPDMRYVVLETVAEGDRVAYRWESTGTHSGTYYGAPPTGRVVTARGITISRFGADGRVVEDHASWNKMSVLHALGIIPLG